MKLDCRVCGQDVFVKTVVHVHGARRTVTMTGWCKQCGHGVRVLETYMAGKLVDRSRAVLAPRKAASGRRG